MAALEAHAKLSWSSDWPYRQQRCELINQGNCDVSPNRVFDSRSM